MIVAIDPGTTESAWCALDGEKIIAFGKDPHTTLRARLRSEWNPASDLLAIEMIASYGMPVGREVFETCLWIGRYLEAWEMRSGTCKLVYRKEVKVFHCESVRATEANIRAALLDRFGPGREKAIGTKREPGPLYGLKGDCWAALAVGLTLGARPGLTSASRPATPAASRGMPF